MNNLILDEPTHLTPNPPELPKFQPEDWYFYIAIVTAIMGICMFYREDKDGFHLLTVSIIFECTYNIIKEIKNGK